MKWQRQPAVAVIRVLRATSVSLLLWLAAGCEHAAPGWVAQPLPVHLPPATPAASDAPASLTVPAAPAGSVANTLALSDQARRFLALQYRSFRTEFMGCMIGALHGDTVVVDRIAPADVEPTHSAATWVVPTQTCEGAGWKAVVGTIHSHVAGQRCWYFFPGTTVPSSDAQVFARASYPVDAIMCGDRVVWISRRMEQRQVAVAANRSPQE